MAELDVMDVGAHCAHPACAQLDFLPFACSGCRATFCLQHRLPSAHACARAGDADLTVVLCPLCAASVRLSASSDANAAWEQHAASAQCDPAAYAARVTVRHCPAVSGGRRCREKLVASGSITCKSCGQTTCLRHRFGDEHGCAAFRAAAASATAARRAAAAAPRAQPNPPPRSLLASQRAAAAPGYAEPGNSLLGTAARRALREACPQCPARFADPAALVAHVLEAHEGAREVCPDCGARFGDPVALVAHFEAAHGRGRAATCSVC